MDLPHFYNFKNSCAIDSLLDLSFYCFGEVLSKYEGYQYGSLWKLLCDVNDLRNLKNECPRALREPVWDWLCANVRSFARKGSTDPAVADVFTHLISTDSEYGLFGVLVNRQYKCISCSNITYLPPKSLCPIILMKDDIVISGYSLEKSVNRSISYAPPTRSCEECAVVSSKLQRVTISLPKFMLIQLPTVPKHPVEYSQCQGDVIDLTLPQISSKNAPSTQTNSRNDDVEVMSGIDVPSVMEVSGTHFHLCGAIKCLNNHFSIAVQYNQLFYDIDGCKVHTKHAGTMADLTGQKGEVYQTKAADGYFIFIYKKGLNTTISKSESVAQKFDHVVSSFKNVKEDSAPPSYIAEKVKSPLMTKQEQPNSCNIDNASNQCNANSACDVGNEKRDISQKFDHVVSSVKNVKEDSASLSYIAEKVKSPLMTKQEQPNSCNIDNASNQCNANSACDVGNEKRDISQKFDHVVSSVKEDSASLSYIAENVKSPLMTKQEQASNCNIDNASGKHNVNLACDVGSEKSGISHSPEADKQDPVPVEVCDHRKYTFLDCIHILGTRAYCSIEILREKLSLTSKSGRKTQIKDFLFRRNIQFDDHFIQASDSVSSTVFLLLAFRNVKQSSESTKSKCKDLQTQICSFLGYCISHHSHSEQIHGMDCYHVASMTGEQYDVYIKCGMPYFTFHDLEDILCIRVGDTKQIIHSKIIAWNLREDEEIIQTVNGLVHSPLLVSWRVALLIAVSSIKVEGSISLYMKFVANLFEVMLSKVKKRSPLKCISNVNAANISKKQHLQTAVLLQNGPKLQQDLRLPYNRCVSQRLKTQREEIKQMTQRIHGGGKENLKLSLQYDIQNQSQNRKDESLWDGSLSSSDLLDILKNTQGTDKRKSVLDEYCDQSNTKRMRLSAEKVISLVDGFNGYNLIGQLRKTMPDTFPSSFQIKKTKRALFKEYQTIMQPKYIPEHTHSKCGIRVNPYRLLICLRFLYCYLPKEEWWKLWGDGRDVGGRGSCLLTISNINNEQICNGVDIHSPEDIWPIAIFYGDDHRWNLESNLGFREGAWLDSFVEKESNSSKFFLTGDAMFLDAIHGDMGEFAPTSDTGYNIYIKEHKSSKGDTHIDHGFRSGLQKSFNRQYPNSIIPSIPIERVVFCIDHAATRVVEKLISLRLKSIAKLGVDIKPSNIGKQEMLQKLSRFKQNIISRGINKIDRIQINSDGTLKERLTLNKSEAHTLLHMPQDFISVFPHLLEGVASDRVTFPVDKHLQNVLKMETTTMSELEIETKIWNYLSHGIMLLRNSDPKPETPEMNKWGLSKDEVDKVHESFDIFHKLFITRYGQSELTPYMMKLVDVAPLLLEKLPIPSLMRFSTEGGEHSHYTQSCYFYQHTQRGGSSKSQDPITSILFWSYRRLRQRILDYSESDDEAKKEISVRFKEWVSKETAACLIQKTVRGFLVRRKIKQGQNLHCENLDMVACKNIVLLGRIPPAILRLHESKENFISKLQRCGLNVRSAEITRLPHRTIPVDMCVICKQSDCESNSPSKIITEALLRKWPILSYDYTMDCIKANQVLHDVSKYALNTGKIEQNATLVSIIPPASVHFQRPQKVKPLTEVKKKKNKKIKPLDGNICTTSSGKIKKKPRPQSGYAYFFSQMAKSLHIKFKDMHPKVKQLWSNLSEKEQLEWKQRAIDKYVQYDTHSKNN